MSNSAKVTIVGKGQKLPPRLLSDERRSVFWDGFVRHREAACRMAGIFVSGETVDDVVDTAVVRFIEALERPDKPDRFPATDEHFRRWFLFIVRNHAINCAHSEGAQRSVHFQWGVEREPVVGGRRSGDRELDRVFARNDQGKYDAPAPTERRAVDSTQELRRILRSLLPELPPMQRRIIHETFFKGRKRAAVADRLGISVKTYDVHLQRAYGLFRRFLWEEALAYTEVDRSAWYDLIEELRERYDAARVLRVSGKKGKRSTTRHERSTSEGERSNAERKSGTGGPAGAA
jgi:RNA polymerase sigma factor (sigma-70 family)